MESNHENLVERGAYHHWLYDQVAQGMQADEINRLSDVFQIENMNGFNPLDLDRAAWATATATGDIALLDFETARSLWRLYDAQAFITDEQNRLRTNALDQFNNPDPQLVPQFQFALQEFTALERELMVLFNRTSARVASATGLPEPEPIPMEVLCRDPFAEESVATPDECP